MAVQIEPSIKRGWEDEGERIALDLDESFTALVIGAEPRAAARVALAIARVQARRRRVAVVDAVGELPPIERLLPDDAAHGLLDMLHHGVSLGRAAIPVDRAGNLFVIPSGAAPLDVEELFASDRWPRLTSSFRDAGALLLVVAPADTSAIERIVPYFDGAVLAGDVRAPAGAQVLAHARKAEATNEIAARAPRRAARTPVAPFWVAIAATVLATIALGWWAVRSSFGPESAATSSITSAGAVIEGKAPGTAAAAGDQPAESPGSTVASATAPAPASQPPAAPDSQVGSSATVDSSAVVPFGVALAQYNDVTAALTRMAQESARGIPASTYAQVYDENLRRQVFLVIAGAFHDRSDATALLRSLRRQRVLGRAQGHVIAAPYAILVRWGLTPAQEKSLLAMYRLRGLPVYSLVQPDGGMNIYAGAFRSVAEAEPLLKTFMESGGQPRVVLRAGRPSQ